MLIVVVLAVVNTAFAFVLWGHTQKVLKSYESVVINNTQTVQVSLLALVLLGDSLSFERWTAILIVTGSAIAVQVAGSPNRVGLVTENDRRRSVYGLSHRSTVANMGDDRPVAKFVLIAAPVAARRPWAAVGREARTGVRRA